MANPHFAVTLKYDVTEAYETSKEIKVPFFVKYLHDCMIGINKTENMRLRVLDDQIIDYDTIHASATILRPNKTFGCSFIKFDWEFT